MLVTKGFSLFWKKSCTPKACKTYSRKKFRSRFGVHNGRNSMDKDFASSIGCNRLFNAPKVNDQPKMAFKVTLTH